VSLTGFRDWAAQRNDYFVTFRQMLWVPYSGRINLGVSEQCQTDEPTHPTKELNKSGDIRSNFKSASLVRAAVSAC
jgi:hypothetical protein